MTEAKSEESNETEKAIKFLERLWKPAAGLIAAVTLVVKFIQLWLGNRELVTWVLVTLSYLAFVILLRYVAFSKVTKRRESLPLTTYEELRYPKYYTLARYGLGVMGLALLVSSGLLAWRVVETNRLEAEFEEKVVVLVADFPGPDPDSYRVTETLLLKLHEAAADYDDTLILALGASISEQEGSAAARSLGEENNADIVLWGWYAVTGSNALVTIHVEFLGEPNYQRLYGEYQKTIGMQTTVAEIESFTLQQNLSTEMSRFVILFGGLLRYEAEDYLEAASRLSRGLEMSTMEATVINLEIIHFYRGNTYSALGEYQKAIADYDMAIQIDPQLSEAYNNRGNTYSDLGEYQKAIADYDMAIQLNPQLGEAYYNRGNTYYALGEYQKAIADYDMAIQIDPQDAEAYANRGNPYYALGEYQKAIADYDMAIQIDPQDFLTYNNRGSTYSVLGEYQKAIADFDMAIQIDPQAEAYYNRGNTYYALGEHQKAIADFERVRDITSDPSLQQAIKEVLEELVPRVKSKDNVTKNR